LNSKTKIAALIDSISDKTLSFNPIYLSELPPESQMMRYDLKFIFPGNLIPDILESTSKNYRILEINEKRVLNYKSHYFDTPEFNMYIDHHNGKGERFKVRIRMYIDTEDKFLEIKKKSNKGLMIKNRVEVKDINNLNEKARNLIKDHTPYDPELLRKTLQTSFCRLTLVNIRNEERITIDFNLNLSHQNKNISLPGLGIAEIKKSDRHQVTHFEQTLTGHNIKPTNFSKYCMGLTLLNEEVKHNNFKRNVLILKKIENEFATNTDI
jgi:hypothetical protein